MEAPDHCPHLQLDWRPTSASVALHRQRERRQAGPAEPVLVVRPAGAGLPGVWGWQPWSSGVQQQARGWSTRGPLLCGCTRGLSQPSSPLVLGWVPGPRGDWQGGLATDDRLFRAATQRPARWCSVSCRRWCVGSGPWSLCWLCCGCQASARWGREVGPGGRSHLPRGGDSGSRRPERCAGLDFGWRRGGASGHGAGLRCAHGFQGGAFL